MMSAKEIEMHIIVNILAIIGVITLVVVAFPVWSWFEARKEAKRLRALPYREEYSKIAKWVEDNNLLWKVEDLSQKSLDFEVIFFDRAEAVVTNFYAFNPESIPSEIRPCHWYVRVWDREKGRDDIHSRIFLCSNTKWHIARSGQYWTTPDTYHVEIADRLGITRTITISRDEDGELHWIDLIKKSEAIVMHSNAVWHYEVRALKGEISADT